MLSVAPWLVTLSRHKQWTFSISGSLIAFNILSTYYIAPRLGAEECSPGNPSACRDASKVSRTLLLVSAAIYLVGFFVAYALGPILLRVDSLSR
jgi:hypothetical protein